MKRSKKGTKKKSVAHAYRSEHEGAVGLSNS